MSDQEKLSEYIMHFISSDAALLALLGGAGRIATGQKRADPVFTLNNSTPACVLFAIDTYADQGIKEAVQLPSASVDFNIFSVDSYAAGPPAVTVAAESRNNLIADRIVALLVGAGYNNTTYSNRIYALIEEDGHRNLGTLENGVFQSVLTIKFNIRLKY